MSTPTTDRAYARGEDAPAGLEAVRIELARNLEALPYCGGTFRATALDGAETFGPEHSSLEACEAWIERKPAERSVVYWVGLNENGAVNVDAAKERAETDHPGFTVTDWGAA